MSSSLCLCVVASLLDSPSLTASACTALAEIGRRNPLPLCDSSLPVGDHTGQITTTDQSGPPTTACVVENLVDKVKSTSENMKVSRNVKCTHGVFTSRNSCGVFTRTNSTLVHPVYSPVETRLLYTWSIHQ